MAQAVSFADNGGIGVLTIDSPPVNALGHAVRKGLLDGIERVGSDDSIRAAVIRSEGRAFSAGADIREFGKPPMDPSLPDLCARIEGLGKPVVAAVHGIALGGGFELALACHCRVALSSAKVGLPEINLGLLPGAGGTQRLPGICGAEAALGIMLSGAQITAGEGAELGCIDRVVDGDLLEGAMELARSILEGGQGDAGVRRRGFENPAAYMEEIAKARSGLPSSARFLMAPGKIIDCVERAIKVPLPEGLAYERAAFMECMASEQSAGLRHMFFAERLAAKTPPSLEAEPLPVGKVGIAGGGTMGTGICAGLLMAGHSVALTDVDPALRERARERVGRILDRSIEKRKAKQPGFGEGFGRLEIVEGLEGFSDCDVVIEAIFEDLDTKRGVFSRLGEVAAPGAILASNTSYLDINLLAEASGRPERVIGLHFFSPAHVMRLTEVIGGARSSAQAVSTGFELARSMGKIPVFSGVCDGFIGNRILARYREVSDFLMLMGSSPYEIDDAMRDFGFPLGPYQVADLAGGDIGWARRKRLAPSRDPEALYVDIPDRLCERGWFGQKTGRGFYSYPGGGRKGAPDPEVLALIEEARAERGVSPAAHSTAEIQEACVFAMINEAARIVEEGIALRPSDIDVVMVHGYGFPRWRGGPAHYAGRLGASEAFAKISGLSGRIPSFGPVASLIRERAGAGGPLWEPNQA